MDAGTGKPLPGVNIILYQGNMIAKMSAPIPQRRVVVVRPGTLVDDVPPVHLHTDKAGHFLFRTLPGEMSLRIENPPHDYLKQRDNEAQVVTLQAGKTVNVTMKLHKGLTVTGAVIDDEGAPVAGVSGYINMPNGPPRSFDINMPSVRWSGNDVTVGCISDEEGHFLATGLPAGKGTLRIYTPQGDGWQSPAPLDIEVPSNTPISVRLKHATPHPVTGRVVDTRQQPLDGVTVILNVVSAHQEPAKLDVVTGTDGCYRLPNIPAWVKISLLSLKKAGYRQPVAGELTTTGKDSIDDAVMTACAAVVHGKVCDGDGKPVAGATVVSVEGGLAARAVSDAAGVFTLSEQPAGELHLVAATTTGGGLATCDSHDPAIITCTPGAVANPVDVPLALQLLDADSQLPKAQRRFNRADAVYAIAGLDIEQANKLALADEKQVPDILRAYLLVQTAKEDPDKVALLELNVLRDPESKLYAAAEVGIAVAKTNSELAERLYQIAKPIFDKAIHGTPQVMEHPEGFGPVTDISLRTVTLAALLHKTTDVDAMLTRLNAQAMKSNNWGNYLIFEPLYEAASRVSTEFILKVNESIDDFDDGMSLLHAMPSIAPSDPAAAERLLEAQRQLNIINDGEFVADMLPVIQALGKLDPAAALALAKAQPLRTYPEALLNAAASQPKEEAERIIRSVFTEEGNRTVMNLARVNAFDPTFAKELYTKYKQNFEAESDHFTERRDFGDDPSDGNRLLYAYLISSIDPVEARLILETEFADARGKVRFGASPFIQHFFPQAMCALDLNRAEQMLKDIHDPVDDRYNQTLFGKVLMRYILMSRAERVSALLF